MVQLNISQETENVVIDIPDLVYEGTILKRRATLDSLFISVRRGEISANWWVEFYANNDGQYGEKIVHPGVTPYMKTFNTRPDDFVDATGTSIIEYATETDDNGNQVATNRLIQPAGTVTAFRFFNWLAANQQVNIHNTIRQNGLKQVALGRF